MKQSSLVKLAIGFVAAILLSGCVLEADSGYRGEGRHEHDRGDQRDNEHHNHGDHDGDR